MQLSTLATGSCHSGSGGISGNEMSDKEISGNSTGGGGVGGVVGGVIGCGVGTGVGCGSGS